MKAAFESEVLLQGDRRGGKVDDAPAVPDIGPGLLEDGLHRSFVFPHMARSPAPPMSRLAGAAKVFRVPEGALVCAVPAHWQVKSRPFGEDAWEDAPNGPSLGPI